MLRSSEQLAHCLTFRAWGLASTSPRSKPKWCACIHHVVLKAQRQVRQRLLVELQCLSTHKTSSYTVNSQEASPQWLVTQVLAVPSWQETASETVRQGKLRWRFCSDLEEVSQLLPPSMLQMVITLQGIKHVLHNRHVDLQTWAA